MLRGQKRIMKTEKQVAARDKKLQEIKKNLLQQKEEIILDADSTRSTLPDETMFPELGDQASAEIDRNFTLRLRDRERKLLKKIDEALEKIENGTYGICDICGQEIGIKRLEARPVTTMCIDCKTEQEEEEKFREK
jgi:DnaK suppressor protein